MKKVFVLCGILVSQGLVYGQTNVVSSVSGAAQPAKAGKTVAESKSKPADATPSPSQRTLARKTQAVTPSDQVILFRRATREGLLVPRKPSRDYYTMNEGIFWPMSDQIGETSIRDTVVTIFPGGK